MLWSIVIMTMLVMLLSLAVDMGRVQVAKTELQRGVDAAARYAAYQYGNGSSSSAVTSAAIAAAADNSVDGTPLTLTSSDISFGTWNSSTNTFTVSSTNVGAIRIIGKRAGSSAIPLTFARVLGMNSSAIQATSIVTFTQAVNVNQTFPATGNPFLAGMPNGSTASSPNPSGNLDYAGTTSTPKQSPMLTGMSVSGGQVITFNAITGNAANGPGIIDSGPDGDVSTVGHNNRTTSSSNSQSSTFYNENGIADAKMPINCTCGVFLDNSVPTSSPAPTTNLDFSTAASRDFTTLSPQLKQIFFIGDGLTSTGKQQQFVVPAGATRLYLATWDFYEWANNSGSRTVVINQAPKINVVK